MALGALAMGKVKTKNEARDLVGLGADALCPYRLERLVEQKPELGARMEALGSLMDFASTINGEVVKMRETLILRAEDCLWVLHSLGREAIREGDGKAVSKLKIAKMVLGMCREFGLWTDQGGAGAPAELEQMRQRQAETMSVESLTQVTVTTFNRDHRRHDGVGPTVKRQREAAQMLAPQTVEAELKPDSPTAEQDSAAFDQDAEHSGSGDNPVSPGQE